MPPKRNVKKKKKKPAKKLNVVDVPWGEQTVEQRVTTIKEIKTSFIELNLKNVDLIEAKETQYPQGMSQEQLAASGACTEAQAKELEKFSNLQEVFDKFDVEVSSVCVGSKMPYLVKAFDMDEKETLILEDRRNKFVFIQFWAPWNHSCNEHISKVADIAARRGAEWGDKVELLAIACDTPLEKLKEKNC